MEAMPLANLHAPDTMTVYLAAPLFSQAERRWNRQLAERLERSPAYTVILPQDFVGGEEATGQADLAALYRLCTEGVERCDAVVAVLDGADADSGTAFEMGYARALGKPIVGVRTDYRQPEERGTNLMLGRSCTAFVYVPSSNENVEVVANAVCQALRNTSAE